MKATTQLLVRIDPKLHKALHTIKVKTGQAITDQAQEALKKWVSESKSQ